MQAVCCAGAGGGQGVGSASGPANVDRGHANA